MIGVGSAAHASLGAALGLERYIAYDSEDVVGVLRQGYPEGIDVLLDLVDDARGIERFVEVVRPGGTLASTIRNSIEPGVFEKRDRVGLSVNLDESPQSSHDGLRRIAAMVESGSLRVPIAAEHDLESGVEALAEVKAGKVTGKSLLTVEPRDL